MVFNGDVFLVEKGELTQSDVVYQHDKLSSLSL